MILEALKLTDTKQSCFITHLLSFSCRIVQASIKSLSMSLAMCHENVRGSGSIAVGMLNLRIRRKLAKNSIPNDLTYCVSLYYVQAHKWNVHWYAPDLCLLLNSLPNPGFSGHEPQRGTWRTRLGQLRLPGDRRKWGSELRIDPALPQ